MKQYRLFYLQKNHIFKAEVLDSETDEGAVALAEQRRGHYVLELWIGARQVGRFEAREGT